MQIVYGDVGRSQYSVFCCFYSLVFCGVQKPKGKLIFRKSDIIHVWHIVSLIAHGALKYMP